MKLFFMLEGRRGSDVPSPILLDVFKLLSRRGFKVEWGKAEETLTRCDLLKSRYDLYLLRSNTQLSLSIAGILHAQDARLLNPYPSCIAIKDKVVASNLLRSADVPIPQSWVTGDLNLLLPIARKIPLVIKPSRGFHGKDIRFIFSSEDLKKMVPLNEPVLIQEHVRGKGGEDLKVYVIEKNVFATRKPFSSESYILPGQQCPVSKEITNIALRCGEVFGLGLYGLDIVESSRGPIVVDVNYFPGYKGISNAPLLLADYIEHYALEKISLPSIISIRSSPTQSNYPMIDCQPHE